MTCDTPTYLPASFKGVQFEVLDTDETFERGNWLSEYPFNDDVGTTDTGLKAQKYTVKGYFNGSDHVVMALALRAAFASGGDGLLIHPVWGPVSVLATSLKFSHNVVDKKRESSFTLECIESGSLFSLISLGGFGNIASMFGSVYSVARTMLNNDWNGSSVSHAYANSVATSVVNLTSSRQGVDEYNARDLIVMRDSLWVAQPSYMMDQVDVLIDGLQNKPAAVDRIKSIVSAMPSVIPNGDDAKSINAITTNVVISSVRAMAIAAYSTDYDTIGDGWNDLDWIIKQFDMELTVASKTCNTSLFSELYKVRKKVLAALMARIVHLPGIVEYDVGIQLPSLLLAHRLYNDSTRAIEIEKYNPSGSPVMMPLNIWGLSR